MLFYYYYRSERILARRTKWGDLLPAHLSRPDAPMSESTLGDKENIKL